MQDRVLVVVTDYLLVDPVLGVGFPVQDFSLFEPESNFLLGVFDRVTSMADVASDLDAEISSDSSRGGFKRVGGSEHLASGGDGLLSFPNHADDRSAKSDKTETKLSESIARKKKNRKHLFHQYSPSYLNM